MKRETEYQLLTAITLAVGEEAPDASTAEQTRLAADLHKLVRRALRVALTARPVKARSVPGC